MKFGTFIGYFINLKKKYKSKYLFNIFNFNLSANEGGNFGNLDYFTPELYARYGNATSLIDYLDKS